MSFQNTVKIYKEAKEDELYEKALKVLESIKFLDHEDWRKSSDIYCPRREGKYIHWEEMMFRHSNDYSFQKVLIVRCFICSKCKCERTIGSAFSDRDGLLHAAILKESCFYCDSDRIESIVQDIARETINEQSRIETMSKRD